MTRAKASVPVVLLTFYYADHMSQLRIHCVLPDSGSSSLSFLIQSVGEVITCRIDQRHTPLC